MRLIPHCTEINCRLRARSQVIEIVELMRCVRYENRANRDENVRVVGKSGRNWRVPGESVVKGRKLEKLWRACHVGKSYTARRDTEVM